jgi:sortase A
MTKSDNRALAILIVLVCLVAAGGVVVIDRTQRSEAQVLTVDDDPVLRLAVPRLAAQQLVPTTTTTTRPAAKPVVSRGRPGPQPAQPVRVPANRYHPEQVREIGVIDIPKINLVHRIFEGVTMNNIDHGPSHWPGTALPGQVGNTVFMGHRVTKTHPFRNIDQLVPGDVVVFTIAGVRSVYRVTGHEIVQPGDTWIVNQTPDATGTLFACHPPGSARYRYVVRLKLSPNE